MKKYDIVMLYSGGGDSRLMLEIAKQVNKYPYCLLIDYGQKHIKELEYAKDHLMNLGINFQQITIKDMNINSGLTGDFKEGRWNNVNQNNVPARNSIFLTLAASIAENNDIQEIWIGCDMSDYYGDFPDCKQDYIGKMNEVFKIAFTKPIEIVAPLLGMTKQMVLNILNNSYGIKLTDIHSGYEEVKNEKEIILERLNKKIL